MSSSSSRDRPSRSMRTSNTSGTSGSSGGDNGGSGSGIPSFMAGTEGQYASLSERLARENELEDKGRRVRWAQTAAAASTMDAANASDGGGPSPMDALADLFARKYTLPVFLVATAGIFLLVHLSGTPDETSVERYDPQANMASVLRSGTVNTYKNVDGGEDGFGSASEFSSCRLLPLLFLPIISYRFYPRATKTNRSLLAVPHRPRTRRRPGVRRPDDPGSAPPHAPYLPLGGLFRLRR